MIPDAWQAARRILAVRLDNLGDVLVTTPALHAIKESLPAATLTLLASPIGAQAGRLNKDIDDVIVYEAPWMDPWHKLPRDSAREQAMITLIRERRFDGAIIFTSFRQSPLPAAYLCYLADIPLRAAASIDGPGSLLTTRHKHPERMMHEVERGLDLVGALGLGTDEHDLVLTLPDRVRSGAAALLAEWDVAPKLSARRGPLVVVHPGCTMPARTYPWEMFAEAVEGLVARLGATVALTGSDGERDLTERVRDRVSERYRARVHLAAGTLPFPAFGALIDAADLVVTNNTGPMHMAAALKTPVVALFALTNPPEQWGPWRTPHRQLYHDVPCRICYSRVCPYEHECLRLVSPTMVVAAAQELLNESSAVSGQRSAAGLLQAGVTGSASPTSIIANNKLKADR